MRRPIHHGQRTFDGPEWLRISARIEWIYRNRRWFELPVRLCAPATARVRFADLSVAEIAHEDQFVFHVESNAVRIFQLRVAAGNLAKRLVVARRLLGVNNDGVLV